MSKQPTKLNPEGGKAARDDFNKFLTGTQFPHPVRHGTRGSAFDDPEWLMMFIAGLSVTAKATNDLAIHRLALQYWNILSDGFPAQIRQKPRAERQLRARVKNSCHSSSQPAGFLFQVVPQDMFDGHGKR
jgi:hypothetical protein